MIPNRCHQKCKVLPQWRGIWLNDLNRTGSLSDVRLRLCALISGLVFTGLTLPALAQRREGVYRPAGSPAVAWKINGHHALIWNGEPYTPFGVRVDGDPSAIVGVAQVGITDVIVDLPSNGAGWTAAIGALEAAKLRYLIRINSMAPMSSGYEVSPQSYRITGIDKPSQIDLPIAGADSVFTVLATRRRDYTVEFAAPVPVVKGRLQFDAKPSGTLEHVLLFYPQMSSLEQPDFWEKLDIHRDTLLTTLRRCPPGPGFRGLINPLGRLVDLPGRDIHCVPTSPAFRIELREALEKKYSAVSTAARAWGMGTNTIQTFDELARLVPLWHRSRGVGLFLDPVTNKTITGNETNATVWRDISEVILGSETRRMGRLVQAIRTVTDVPVVQEWVGWSPAYEASAPAPDGLGIRASGITPSELANSGGRAASSVMRWSTPGWLPATDVDLGGGADLAQSLPGVSEDLLSMGARAVFFRADDPKLVAAVVEEAKKHMADATLAGNSPRPIYFPENALNPAVVQRLPNNAWWLPAPSDGDRIDLGPDFFAYRYRQTELGSALVMWTRTPGRYKLRLTNPKAVSFATLDGSDPMPKSAKGGVEVTLTQIPLLILGGDEVAVPEVAYTQTLTEFDALLKSAETQHRDTSEEKVAFQNALNGFDRNPGGNFGMLRSILARLGAKIGTSTWIEGEQATDTNFSEPMATGSASGGSALALRTPIPAPASGYFAHYKLPMKTSGEQTIWVAARIPREYRGDLTIQIGTQVLGVVSEPVGGYGDGFGWFRLGTTRLSENGAVLKVRFSGQNGVDLAIDAIVLTPNEFKPDGVLVRPANLGG